jgi:hypothetical protein
MAHTRNNVITRGSSGKMGEAVFTIDGKMRSRPDTSNRAWSELQKNHLDRFEKAKEYARVAISEPELNDFYAAKAASKHGLGAWHLAIKDFYHPPEILKAEFREFQGKSGNEVYIEAYDIYKVTGIMVSFNSPEGIILEEGSAYEYRCDIIWRYWLKSDIELVPGLSVTIGAKDVPGNITRVILTWPFDCSKTIHFGSAGQAGTAKKRQKSQLRIRRV